MFTGTARLSATNAVSPLSPLLANVLPSQNGQPAPAAAVPRTDAATFALATSIRRPALGFRSGPDSQPRPMRDSPSSALTNDATGQQRVRQYTLGGTAALQGSARWSHVVTAGVDGYRLAGVGAEGMLVPSAVDSALRAARGGADRLTLRASSTARAGSVETRGLIVTLGVEHSTAREESNSAGTRIVAQPQPQAGQPREQALQQAVATSGTTWWHNTGALAQGQLVLRDRLFVTGGARLEHISGPTGDAQLALLPMLGGSWVLERGGVTTKLRTAYGRGIRPARTVARGATWSGGRVEGALTSLAPEEQAGIETGIDLLWGDRLGFHATRFDQRASGLVQPVALVDSTSFPRGSGGPMRRQPRIAYLLQNVGAIDNTGWELQATAGQGPLRIAATLSLVSSRVARLASGYGGDLRAGDRILEVPARTLGVTTGWTARRWSVSSTVARASDWINYDRLGLAQAITRTLGAAQQSAESPARVPVGPELRRFWQRYDGAYRASARASYGVWRSAAVTLSADNLFDRQLGEPDNVTVLPGRTLALGLRTSF